MQTFLITALREGTIAFCGYKLVTVLGQKEVGEVIAAGGIAIVGVEGVKLIVKIVNGVQKVCETMSAVGDHFSWMQHLKVLKP